MSKADASRIASAITGAPNSAVRRGVVYAAEKTGPNLGAASARSVSKNAGPPIGRDPANAAQPALSASVIPRPARPNTAGHANAPTSAFLREIAPNAAGIRTSPTGDCARTAASAGDAGSASDTPGHDRRVGSMAERTSAQREGRPGEIAASARKNAAMLRNAFVAASAHPSRADRAASRAWIRGGSPTGRRMPSAGPPGCAPGARRRRSRGYHCAGSAL